MSAWEGSQAQCDRCDGVFGHRLNCPAYVKPKATPAQSTKGGRYRYQGREYAITVQARSPNGPVTLVNVADPADVIDTTNDKLVTSLFERVS